MPTEASHTKPTDTHTTINNNSLTRPQWSTQLFTTTLPYDQLSTRTKLPINNSFTRPHLSTLQPLMLTVLSQHPPMPCQPTPKVLTLLIHTTILESVMLKPKPNLMPGTTTPTPTPHTHNTTDSTTESTTVFMVPVLEYTMLTQPTSMELESMVPTHTHNTANSNKDFRYSNV